MYGGRAGFAKPGMVLLYLPKKGVMKNIIAIMVLWALALNLQAQDDAYTCWVKAYPGSEKGTVVLEYRLGANKGTLDLQDTTERLMGMRGSTTTPKDGKTLKTQYYCYTIPDTSHFWVPSAQLMDNGQVVCNMQGFWVAVDTLQWGAMPDDSLPYSALSKFNCAPPKLSDYTMPTFEWLAGVEPVATIIVGKKVAMGDTLHVTITSNFPSKEILSRMRLRNLERYRTLSSKSSFTQKEEGVVTGRSYTEVIVLRATFKGEASIEVPDFEYLGKKITVRPVKIKVK